MTITNIAIDHNSAKITFKPVPGAVDYRIYDVSDPSVVKYAGQMMYSSYANGQRFVTTNNDGINASYPLLLESLTSWGDWATTSSQELTSVTAPLTTIEWNRLSDHQPHALVVQAVDQLGPMSPDNAYTVNYSTDTIIPTHPAADSTYGSNEGPTPDGKTSINGQGPSTDNPNVIAQSAPFTVQANPSIVPVPTDPEATQTYLDTFDNGEASSLTYLGGHDGPNGDNVFTYTVNSGQQNASTIFFEGADPTYSQPMIEDGHYMDILADSSSGDSWATMALTPKTTPDISNGQMLHMSMEVDSVPDLPGRRWIGFDVAPANDPIQNHNQNVFTTSPINNSDQAVFIGIGNPGMNYAIATQEYTGPASVNNGQSVTQRAIAATRDQQTFSSGLDNRDRFDLFLTQTHYALYENGALADEETFPTPLPYSKLSVSYAHYYYHSAAEKPEEDAFSDPGPVNKLYANVIPFTDERHWANLGFEVLPSTDVPTDWTGNLNMLANRAQPPGGTNAACPGGWSCDDIGKPFVSPSSQYINGGTWTINQGGTAAGNSDPNQARFVSHTVNGDTSISTRLTNHIMTHNNGLAGVMMRSSLDENAPFYSVGDETEPNWTPGEFYLHYWYRATAGGPLNDVKTSVADPIDSHQPVYLKIGRQGNLFTAYTSSDGNTWTAIPGTSQTINMPASILAGLADMEPGMSNYSPQNPIGSATFDTIAINGASPPSATSTPTMMPMPSMTTIPGMTPTMMPMPSMTPASTPTGSSGGARSVLYDDTTGAPGSGWSDCSQVKYEHWTMTGMGGPGGNYTLHTEILPNQPLAFCNAGIAASPFSALDFWVLADPGSTTASGAPGDNFSIAITTTSGTHAAVPVDSFIQGGDSQLMPGTWEHVIVPLSTLGVSGGSSITQVAFIGTGTTSYPVFYFDEVNLTGGGVPAPTATVDPSSSSTPAAASPTGTATATTASNGGGGTTLGYARIGASTDQGDGNALNGLRVTTGASGGPIQSLSVYVGAVDSAPNNAYQLALYSDSNGQPGTLLAQSPLGTLQPNAWNTLPLSAPTAVQPNSAYWLVYNTNTTSATLNTLHYDSASSSVGAFAQAAVPFGSFPATFGPATLGSWQFSLYATLAGGATLTPTATSTGTPLPPTATSTSTPVPPTSTSTPVPPTSTSTPVPPTNTSTPVASPPQVTVMAAAVSPGAMAMTPGSSEHLSATISTNMALSGAIVDFEVYDPSGAKIYQSYQSGLSLAAGSARTLSATWTPPPSCPTGMHTFKIGVFSAGWTQLYTWDNQAATFMMSAASGSGTPAPTATSTPRPAATSTSTPTAPATATLQPAATNTPTPGTGGSGSTLGTSTIGPLRDSGDAGTLTAARLVTGANAESVRTLSAYVGAVDAAPHNQYALALYSDSNGAPGALLAHSTAGTLQPQAWNSRPLSVSLTLQPHTAYWLVYATNASSPALNDLAYQTQGVSSNVGAYSAAVPFGTWPAQFGPATLGPWQYSLFAAVSP